MEIIVIGGSGLIGSRLVATLRANGHEAVSAAPDSGIDTLTGEGLEQALHDASVVVDVSEPPSFADAAALDFFERSTSNLLAAEAAAGVGHHVALSVAGTDSPLDSGYFRGRRAQQQLIATSAIPYSIVHTAPFFELIRLIAEAATDGDTVRLAPVIVQPAAAEDVANALATISVGAPLNGFVEIAGPDRFRLDELVGRVLGALGDPRQVVTDPLAPYFGARLGELTLVPSGEARLGGLRFEDWLTQPGNVVDDGGHLPSALKATGEKPDRQFQFLQRLVAEHATIDGDVVEVDEHTWAIHGFIAVDGEVIMAEYETQDEARHALDKLAADEHGTVD
jgi:uncharacterized protein YbjT (DUF2867 family)